MKRMNCTPVRSPLGLLKLVLMVTTQSLFSNQYWTFNCFQALLLSIVILSYIGNEGGRLFFGLGDFLGVGTSVGFAIVIPLVFITYLGNGNILVFVSLLSCYQQNILQYFLSGSDAKPDRSFPLPGDIDNHLYFLLTPSVWFSCRKGVSRAVCNN